MNLEQAKRILQDFSDLKTELSTKVPKEVTADTGFGKQVYTLHEVDVAELTANYRYYLGRGDYEYWSTPIDLDELFPE